MPSLTGHLQPCLGATDDLARLALTLAGRGIVEFESAYEPLQDPAGPHAMIAEQIVQTVFTNPGLRDLEGDASQALRRFRLVTDADQRLALSQQVSRHRAWGAPEDAFDQPVARLGGDDPVSEGSEGRWTEGAWRAALQETFQCVTPREEKILRLRFGLDGEDGLTLTEVGEKFGVSKETIRQIERMALSKLKHSSDARRILSPFLAFDFETAEEDEIEGLRCKLRVRLYKVQTLISKGAKRDWAGLHEGRRLLDANLDLVYRPWRGGVSSLMSLTKAWGDLRFPDRVLENLERGLVRVPEVLRPGIDSKILNTEKKIALRLLKEIYAHVFFSGRRGVNEKREKISLLQRITVNQIRSTITRQGMAAFDRYWRGRLGAEGYYRISYWSDVYGGSSYALAQCFEEKKIDPLQALEEFLDDAALRVLPSRTIR